jgi:hypothetical protein
MKVYVAYGTVKDGELYRKEEQADPDAIWPPDELTEGVGNAGIHLHGDDPEDAFVVVRGTDRDAVDGMWRRIVHDLSHTTGSGIASAMQNWWP